MIATVAIWFFGQIILDQLILRNDFLVSTFGLSPAKTIFDFYVWQPITYMFLHSTNPTHVLMNMLMLWWLGGELETRWGSRFFGLYYFVCGIGAGVLYVLGALIYWSITGSLASLMVPVIGASGAVFGLLLAYGMVFGERVVLFMFLFQMKAKYLVAILGMVEVVTIINNGVGGSSVANLAHVSGLIVGFIFLSFWTKYQSRRRKGIPGKGPGGSRLQVVVSNNEERKGSPTTWH